MVRQFCLLRQSFMEWLNLEGIGDKKTNIVRQVFELEKNNDHNIDRQLFELEKITIITLTDS
jgi:hypothetical protein